jgi:hypothetical protein
MQQFYKVKKPLGLLLSCALLAGSLNTTKAQQIAFPGAEGFGKYATGGRGGKVVEVINLNDAGAGSFRDAFTKFPGEPITIVFRVGGTIELLTQLKVNRSNFTIAGQTAPGDGICLKGHSFLINGARAASQGGNHGNIIIRHLRSRPGSTLSTGVYGFDMENCHNVIVDHCSFSWANEENAAMYDIKNITVQYSIASEGLYNAGHAKGVRSYGGVWGGQYVTYHHNLIAHNVSRTVRFNGSRAHDTIALVDYRNNVIYNWGSSGAAYGGEVEINGGVSRVNVVNNYYKPGPATSTTLRFIDASYIAGKPVGEWHVAGNIMEGNTNMTNDNWLGVYLDRLPADQRANAKSTTPFPVDVFTPTQTAADAYLDVLANAGATKPMRDAVDARVVNETRTKTASGIGSYGKPGIIDAPSAVGGWPTYIGAEAPTDEDHDGMADEWETAYGLSPANADDRNTVGSDGFTMLEKYLNSLTVNQALPLKLTSFNGTRTGNTVTLFWTTINEVNANDFLIEKSSDGSSFSAISTIQALNNTASNNYSFKDVQFANGVSFYRLQMKDKDGKVTYSPTLSFNTRASNTLLVYPNPAIKNITISHPKASTGSELKIYNSEGKLVLSYKVPMGSEQSSIDISKLPKGLYSVASINHNIKTVQQFVKQ